MEHSRRSRCNLVAVSLLAALSAPLTGQTTGAVSARSAGPPDNGNWEMPGKNYAATRFTAMREITPANIARMKLVASKATGNLKGHEAPPLVDPLIDGPRLPMPQIAVQPQPKKDWSAHRFAVAHRIN